MGLAVTFSTLGGSINCYSLILGNNLAMSIPVFSLGQNICKISHCQVSAWFGGIKHIHMSSRPHHPVQNFPSSPWMQTPFKPAQGPLMRQVTRSALPVSA